MSGSSLSPRGALGLVALGAAAISAAPILVKLLVAEGVGPTSIALWRVATVAVLLLAAARPLFGRMLLPARALRWAAVAGVAFALDLFVWHRSIVLVGAGMATILANTQVFWIAALAWLLFREPLGARVVVGAVVAFAGVVLLAGVGSGLEVGGDYLLGVAYGLATGVCYASFILGVRQISVGWTPSFGPPPPPPLALGWALAFAAAALVAIGGLEGTSVAPGGGRALLYLALLALGVQLGGWLSISTGLPRLPAARAGLMLLLQPALAAVWGALFFGESLKPLQIAGAALILGGVYLGTTRVDAERPRRRSRSAR